MHIPNISAAFIASGINGALKYKMSLDRRGISLAILFIIALPFSWPPLPNTSLMMTTNYYNCVIVGHHSVHTAILYSYLLGCGHIRVDYSGIRCTFLRAREYLKSNIMISLYRVAKEDTIRKVRIGAYRCV